MTFLETGLRPELLSSIAEMGFETPTPIQEKTIPHLLTSTEDLVALAQTGTGKTAAFGLPLLHLADTSSNNVQALILCPTRELCLQIARDMEAFSKNLKGIRIAAVYGGADINKQIRELRAGAQIVVGTPGRVNDLIRRKMLNVSSIRWAVLDEADEMLTMGFKEEMDAILSTTPAVKQTLLFSATMPKEIADLTDKFLTSAVELSVGRKNAGAENVEHHYYVVHARDKYLTLKRIADNYPNCYAIVFCRTRMETREVAEKFMADGYNADALHGDLSQAQRDYVMSRFRSRNLQMLVATDVAARGLDVNDLTHVINYSLPDDPEVYIHRSGRTGRAGKSGIAVSILHMKETGKLRQIEQFAKRKFNRQQVPGGEEICQVQLLHLVDKVVNVEVNTKQIAMHMPAIMAKMEGLDREAIIQHFVSAEFNRFLAYYKNAPDLNVPLYEKKQDDRTRERGDRSDRGGRGDREQVSFSRLFINVGKKQNLNAPRLIGLINENLRKRNVEIGKIDIQRKFSFFEIDARYEQDLVKSLNQYVLEGHPLEVGRVTGQERPPQPRPRGKKSSFSKKSSGGGGYRR